MPYASGIVAFQRTKVMQDSPYEANGGWVIVIVEGYAGINKGYLGILTKRYICTGYSAVLV